MRGHKHMGGTAMSETHGGGVTPKYEGRVGRPQPPKKWGKGVDPRVSQCKGKPVGVAGGIFGVMENSGAEHKHVWGS